MKAFGSVLLCVLAVLVVASPASATLVGDEVGGELHFPSLLGDANAFDPALGLNPVTAIVGPGIEFVADFVPLGGTFVVTADLSSEFITLTATNTAGGASVAGGSSSMWFTDLDWVDGPGIIVGVVQVGGDFFQNTPSWTADSIHFDTPDFTLAGFQTVTSEWQILVEHFEVPEPATMTLLGLGLVGLAYRRRKKA